MNQSERKQLACELSALSVFRGILKQEAMAALLQFLGTEDLQERMAAYGTFVSELAEDGCSLSDFLCRKPVKMLLLRYSFAAKTARELCIIS